MAKGSCPYPKQYKEVMAEGAESLVYGLDFAQAIIDFTYRVRHAYTSTVAFRLHSSRPPPSTAMIRCGRR